MENNRYPKVKKITLAIQKHNIKKKFKNLILRDYSRLDINMLLKIQPNINSKNYIIWLKYESVQKKPKIYIELNQLYEEKIKGIPHNYGIKEIKNKQYIELCLFYKEEWNATMNIADTIIPWTCEWLYFYEIWVITGKWYGGGKHLKKEDIENNDKN